MSPTDPETVIDAIAALRERGFDADLDVVGESLIRRTPDGTEPFAGTHVDHVFRFEGDSNPSDESIVIGISGGADGRKGVLVSTYGPDVDRGHEIVLGSLDLGGRWD